MQALLEALVIWIRMLCEDVGSGLGLTGYIEFVCVCVCMCVCVLEIWNDDFHEGFHDRSQFTLHVRKKKSQQAAPKQRPVEQL